MQWTPTFTWATGSWEASLPTQAFEPIEQMEGGWSRAASGVQASYVIREQSTLRLTLRMYEWEWHTDVRDLVRAAARSLPITVRLDPDDATTEFVCYVDDVRPGGQDQTIRPVRDQQFRPVFTLTMTIRRADGGDIDVPFYEDPDA